MFRDIKILNSDMFQEAVKTIEDLWNKPIPPRIEKTHTVTSILRKLKRKKESIRFLNKRSKFRN